MTAWRCPACGAEARALASGVGHRCSCQRLRWVTFKAAPAVCNPFAGTPNRHSDLGRYADHLTRTQEVRRASDQLGSDPMEAAP
jgi:hypothetical protein